MLDIYLSVDMVEIDIKVKNLRLYLYDIMTIEFSIRVLFRTELDYNSSH